MQRIERYGVIALIFLLVTIVAVSFWGENGEGGLWSRFTGAKTPAEPAPEVARHDPRVNARAVARSIGDELPLSTPRMQGAAAPQASSSNALAERRALRRRALEEQGQVPGRTQEDLHGLDLATNVSDEPLRAAPYVEHQPLASEPVRDAAPVAQRASPLAARAATVQPAASGGTYVVQAGDTLGEIAQKTLGSAARWKEIQAVNEGLDPKKLFVGAKLVLPGGASGASTAAAAPVKQAPATATAVRPAAGRTYVVRSGDTLSRIAASQLGDAERWREIAAANPRVDPKRLFVGAQLVLPGERSGALVAYAERTQPERAQPLQAAASSAKPRVR